MLISIRPAETLTDYQVIAEILTASSRGAVDPKQLQSEDTHLTPPVTRRRVVAVNSANIIVGTSLIRHEAWMSAGQFALFLAVAPPYRRQGIGSQLYAEAVAYTTAYAATELGVTLSDDVPEALSFAEQRGFTLQQHWAYWQLPLLTFDEAPFLAKLSQVQARGIRFFSLADAGNTAEAQQKLYDLNRRTSLDAPGEESFPTFEEFVHTIVRAPWFRPDAQIVAADVERWVGLGAVGIDGQTAFNAFTGVDRDYRQQGLAMALSLLSIRYARQHNATHIEVFNDSRNTPMFKLQERLGYYRIPGRYIMKQVLGTASA